MTDDFQYAMKFQYLCICLWHIFMICGYQQEPQSLHYVQSWSATPGCLSTVQSSVFFLAASKDFAHTLTWKSFQQLLCNMSLMQM